MKDEAIAHMPLMPLFKYLSLASGAVPTWQDRFTQLLNGEAYFPSPQDFNDPFDCLPVARVPDTQEELEGGIDALISRFVLAMDHMPAAEIAGLARANLAGKTPADFAEMARHSGVKTADSLGVFCLTENIKSVLMWSHYANNHSGIALVFEVLAEPPKQGLPPFFKVNYLENRPVLEGLFKLEGFQNEIMDALLVKADCWKYEQEWRSFSPEGARKIVKFDRRIITGIVFGANCKPEDETWIREAVGRPMRYFRVVPDAKTFDLSLAVI